MNLPTIAALVVLSTATFWTSQGEAATAPPPPPVVQLPPTPAPDFSFIVPVDLKNLHRKAVAKGVWVVCNVYDHGVVERDQAHTELESKWSLAKAEEIQRWHLGQGRTELTIATDGSVRGRITVKVDIDEASGEASDARSWECHLAIASSKLPTRDRSKPAFLRAKRGTVFAPVHRGDL
ncbi:MAG: hypothetical protein JKY37_05500 [Nannocystaceae bacterium]|nr:hypothetical protein [Nannocystaceae bacterium]